MWDRKRLTVRWGTGSIAFAYENMHFQADVGRPDEGRMRAAPYVVDINTAETKTSM